MYTGRTVACGKTLNGDIYLLYRVNSRSFSNRKFINSDGIVSVVPSEKNSEDYSNHYVTYNCCRYSDDFVSISNGTQTDPIFEKIIRGAPLRDTIISTLHGIDYEFDGHDTPRIVVAASSPNEPIYMGIISKNKLQVEGFELINGELRILSTNNFNFISQEAYSSNFDANNIEEVMNILECGDIFSSHEYGVLGLCVKISDKTTFTFKQLS